MNVFTAEKGRLQVAQDAPPGKEAPAAHVYTTENWVSKVIDDLGARGGGQGSQGGNGRFKFAF